MSTYIGIPPPTSSAAASTAHTSLTGVTPDQHHAEAHTHAGAGTEVHGNESHTTLGFPESSVPGDSAQQGSSTAVARLDHQHSRENTLGAFGTRDHDLLTGLTDDDHTQYVLHTEVDDTPVDGVTTDPISSNWAFDHVAAADPHSGYRLESADHTHVTTGLQGGTVAHSALTGLTTGDDHTQYQKETDFTAGSVLFRGASAISEDNANFFWDDTNNRLGIGTNSPTSFLHIRAGTAIAGTAPLKFTSGALLTSAEAGAVEFLTDAFYGTITTGAARKTFAFLESPTFTGTLTAPTIISTTVLRLKNYTVATLPAGTQGDKAFVTDALAPTYLTTVVGGGAIVTEVFYDGTNWVCT